MTKAGNPEDRRRYPRVKAPVLWRYPRLRKTRHRVVDIGLGGMRVYSDDRLKVDDRLSFELFLPDDITVKCLVQVVWIQALGKGGPAKYDVGLRLLDFPPKHLATLRAVLDDTASGG